MLITYSPNDLNINTSTRRRWWFVDRIREVFKTCYLKGLVEVQSSVLIYSPARFNKRPSIINLQTEGVPGGKQRLAHKPAVWKAGLQLPSTGVQPRECWLPPGPAGSHGGRAPGDPEMSEQDSSK